MLKSLELEKHVLNGLLNNPEVISEIEGFVSEKDFTASVHVVIYTCIRSTFLKNERIDKTLIAQQIHNLGISFKDDISIFSYLESISFTVITPEATKQACKELVKFRVLRDIEKTADEIKSYVNKSANNKLEETISEIDGIYNNKINLLHNEERVISIFENLSDLAEETGNNPQEEIGISTPYPEFNRLYGGLRNKNLYIIAARAKAGKSNWISETASEISKIHKIPVLILDTELSTKEVQFRTIAAKTGVGLWYIESGAWRKNELLFDKVKSSLKDIKQNYNVDHYFIGNKKIEEVMGFARRWYLQKVGRGNKCLICFDYIKMIDKLGYNQQEYQLMGDKVDLLKKLAEELDCPILTAVQANRSGITTNKSVEDLIDDESSVGISDRILWYATYVGILRRKVVEEIVLDTPQSGTHKMIELVARFQGKDAAGHQDLIERNFPNGKKKYVKNYINFNIQNFKVEEKGSIKHSIERQNSSFTLGSSSANETL
jgi:replicative DNA helicase